MPLQLFLRVGWKEVRGQVALVKKMGDRAFPVRHPGGDGLWNGMIECATSVGDKFYRAINSIRGVRTPRIEFSAIFFFVVSADLAHV